MWPKHGSIEKKKTSSGEGDRRKESSDPGWGCLDLMSRLCPSYWQMDSAAALPFPCNVLCNVLAMLQDKEGYLERPSDSYGGERITLYSAINYR